MTIVYCSWDTGDDTTGDGSAATPYKTITKASTGRSPGDEIRVEKSPDPTALTGTTNWTFNSKDITGASTLFTTELAIGDFISAPDGHWYEVVTITDNTHATLYKVYPSATVSGYSSQKLGVTDTGEAAAVGTVVQEVMSSGNSSDYLYISGGWDLSTQTQTGQTWFRQKHTTFANRYGYGLYAYYKNYVNLDKINFLRYYYGIHYKNASNNIISNAICNSNGSCGIYYKDSNNNTITNMFDNSNSDYGVYYDNSNGNNITSAICNSNDNYGIHYLNSYNNIIKDATCNLNYTGIIYDTSSNNIITKAICNSNRNYGVYYINGAGNNTIGSLSTTGNASGSIYGDKGINVIHNASITESTKAAFGTSYYADTRININNMGGYSYVYSNYAIANSQNATAGGTGKEWKFSISNANRNRWYPFYIPVARIAVEKDKMATVKLWFKKSGVGVAGALRCRAGQLAWSDPLSDIVVECPNNTNRNQVTLQFTPTEAGVVEIEAGAWYESSTADTVIVDDIEVSQA